MDGRMRFPSWIVIVPEVSQHRFHASGTFPKRKPEQIEKALRI
jgi:hypothetical protein